MRRRQFGTRLLLVLMTVSALFLSFVFAAVRAYRLATRTQWIVTRGETDLDHPYFRIAVLYDRRERCPLAIAIEKTHPHSFPRPASKRRPEFEISTVE